ncbi:DEKNAAC103113 [Brettanomyces naardenensis]|uniref:DEKNAAC103113 n=1 Tax=Brettanomyces naardenensis TaxID=13370 RepID=A0A448YML7_BRENA|nr:DEKNAAC103113 [Brettanomyces naardenensis]
MTQSSNRPYNDSECSVCRDKLKNDSIETTQRETPNDIPAITIDGYPLSRYPSAGDLKEAAILTRASQSQVNLAASFEQQKQQEQLARHLPVVKLPYGFGPVPPDNGKVFFFDIDNCLYKKSTKIHDLMQIYIHRFFKKHLHLNDKDAYRLHMKYYKEYGLAIEGLVREHRIDALEYNKVVDDALPLDQILKPNVELRNFLIRMKNSGKVDRLWLFTNAYKNHGLRVIRLLGIGDLFDGMTFCEYANVPMVCKPLRGAFDKALEDAGVTDPKNAYFLDDSEINVEAAVKYGWGHVARYLEGDEEDKEVEGVKVVRDVKELETVYPELFNRYGSQ